MPNRIEPRNRQTLEADIDRSFALVEKANGYTPNSYLILAHKPEIYRAFSALAKAILRDEGEVPKPLKFMVAAVSSRTGDCVYCLAHNVQSAAKSGIDPAKIHALWNFEDSALFSAAEKAAFTLARHAASVPNQTTDADFSELRKHFTDTQIVEIVTVIALFGWNNRWNSTLASALEGPCLAFAEGFGLSRHGWSPRSHV